MAGIQYIAIPGLTWDSENSKIYYESKTINIRFAFERDVTFLNYLIKWVDFDLKITIKDNSGNTTLYSDKEWVRLTKDVDYLYNTESNLGKYAIVKASRTIKSATAIGSIEIQCKRGASDSVDYSKTIRLIDGNTLYKNIDITTSNDGFSTTRYTTSLPSAILPSNKCSVSNPDGITIKGAGGTTSYRSSKYHNGALEINFTGVNYLGETVFPKIIEITDGTFSKQFSIDANNKTYSRILTIDKNQLIKTPYWVKYYIGLAVYTKEFSNTSGFYPLSEFVNQELDLTQLNIKAYDIPSAGEIIDNDTEYTVTQRSLVQGKIKMRDDNVSPYSFSINTDEQQYYVAENIKSDYTFSNNVITLKDNIPFGEHIFYSSSGSWGDNATFFNSRGNYKLKIRVIQRFNSSSEWIEIPINNYINYRAAPIIFNKALQYQVTYKTNTYDNLLILNPKETLKVGINKKYVFFPALQKYWNTSTLDGCSYQIYYFLSDQQNPTINETSTGLALNSNYIKTHEAIISGLNTYTKFLKFGLKVSQGSNSVFCSMNTVRIGRVQEMKISSCQIKGGILTYYLSDYGGDKTASLPASSFIPYDSSLSRSGNEKLTLVFKDINGEEIGSLDIGTSLLGNKEEARKKFYENVPIKLPLSLLTTDAEVLARISQIEGTYFYSYSGIDPDQTTFFFLSAKDIENVTNNPTWSLRKNGVIINGKPGQKITPISETDETAGKYFVEINALDVKDRIIINFPGNVSAEIYCKDNKICLSDNIVIGDTGVSLADIALIAGIV